MGLTEEQAKDLWERSFRDQIAWQANNTAPVEAIVRNVSYYLRSRFRPGDVERLHFLEMGCGTGPNLLWLARRGIQVSGVDISPIALELAGRTLKGAGLDHKVGALTEGTVTRTTFPDASFDGVIESCVFQHLGGNDRRLAFAEVGRLLKPGGIFAGYMLDVGHTLYMDKREHELPDDPGTLLLRDGATRFLLENLGLTHFYRKEEIVDLLRGFAIVDPCLTTYHLPGEEARRRGYTNYLQSMWAVYAIR